MQHTTQQSHSTVAPPTTSHAHGASIHARTSAVGSVQPTKSAITSGVPAKDPLSKNAIPAKPTAAALQPQRRALHPLDGNRLALAAPVSVAVGPKAASGVVPIKTPFVYVSRFSRPLPPATAGAASTVTKTTPAASTSGSSRLPPPPPPPATVTATSLTGLKRKQKHLEALTVALGQPPQHTAHAAVEHDTEALRRRENVAWLDMLVALLERKYQAYAPPVCADDLEAAGMLNAYWPANAKRAEQQQQQQPSSAKRSRLSLTASSHHAAEDEKEERRAQALRRHAQQIQDTSVASTSCCGCKTGCLKMYCVCFSTRGYCHDGCSCDNCKNARACADQRLEAITSYLTNDPRAFSYAAAAVRPASSANAASASSSSSSSSPSSSAGFFQLLPEKSSTVVLRGCRCKKSKCLKKYCECFQNGLGCSPHCRCVDCSNDASAAARELRAKNKSDAAASAGGMFHAIKVAVTKKPRRNFVAKSVRLRL